MIKGLKKLLGVREGKFEVYDNDNGQFRFRYVSANNKIMFHGEAYTRHNNVKRALKSISKQLGFKRGIRVQDYVTEETYFV